MLQQTESKVIELLEKHTILTAKKYQQLTGSKSFASIVHNINRKFPEKIIEEKPHRKGRVTFSWNRSEDVTTETHYYLSENYKELLQPEKMETT